MRKLILIRHAAVQMDDKISSHQWPLSADGRTRCGSLASQIAAYDPGIIITSIEPKAVETGQIVADVLSLPWQTAADLQEHDRQGVPVFADRADFEAAVAALFRRPDEQLFGRETAVQACDRFDRAVTDVVNSHPTGNLAIVTHGTVLTLFLCRYNPHLDPVLFWKSLSLPDYYVVSLPNMKLF